jgi:YHS domain-containing protein
VRALQLLAVVLLVAALLVPWLRRRSVPTGPRGSFDELVKDPVCQTYVVRSRAVTGTVAGPPYFCSAECARRWAVEPRG